MISKAEILQRLSPYRGMERVIVGAQDTRDIMDGIEQWHGKYKKEYDKISGLFVGETSRKTAANLFNFLKGNVEYRIETEAKQTLKSPAAIIAQGYGDCKHYSLFIAGVIDSINRNYLKRIPWTYRFASYKLFDETPQHVFVVINPGTNKEIWVDPVLSRLDQKKPYTNAIDSNNMALVGISGVHGQVGGIKDVLKKGKTVVLKVAAAPARGAFLTLVRLNVFNLAGKLNQIWQRNPQNLKNWWAGLGGEINKLTDVIEKGAKKKRIGDAQIGLDPLTDIAALLTAAAPILLAVVDLFKKNQIDASEIEGASREGLNERAKEAANEIVEPIVAEQENETAGEDAAQADGKFPTAAVVLGAGVIVFLMMSKKK